MIKIINDNRYEEVTYIYIFENKCFIVDPGVNTKKIIKEVKNYTVEAILLTHGHFDHTEGARELYDIFKCKIYAHKLEIPVIVEQTLNLGNYENVKVNLKREMIIPLESNQKINLVNKEVKIIHTPGHTKGSACFLIENILFSGDTLFRGTYGRVDLPTGNARDMVTSLKKLKQLDSNIIVYPGHGEFTTIESEC